MLLKKSRKNSVDYAESIINTIRESLIVLDKDLRVVTVSRSFYEFFKVKPEDTIGQLIYDLGDKQWDIPKLRELLEVILPDKNPFENYEVEHNFETIGRRVMLLNARQIEQEKIILLAIENITERKDIEVGLEKTRKELEVTKKIAVDASAFAESIINTVREPLISLDKDLRVLTVSRSFCEFFKVKPEDTIGQLIYDLGDKQWDIPKLRELFEVILPYNNPFEDYEVEHNFETIGRRVMLLNARQIEQEKIILLAMEDVTERKDIEAELDKELQNERNRFALAIEGTQDGLWDWNLETGEVLLSRRFETMLGYNVGDFPQKIDTWFGLLHPDDKEETLKIVKEYLDSKGKKSYESTFRLRTKDGSWRWILGRGKARFSADGTPLRFVGFFTDISQQMEYQDKLNHTAKHDSLTHLPNRFLLSELLTQAMHSVKRKNQYLALLFIDLDGFKAVNDTYGHDVGDVVLTTIADRMNHIVRDYDIVSRIGGDEFVIVVSELKNRSELIPLLQRLLSDLSSNIVYEGNSMNVSASIGVSLYPQADDIGNEALLRQADQAMYQAKLSGKNQYQYFNLEASQELKSQQQDILNLREAIKKDEFVLYYQPKVNMTNNKVIGFEALLRWNHPIEGLIYPDSFLPLVAHQSSFMIELGHWVLENAFSQLETWHLAGLDIILSVNVSSHEIQQESFSTYLKELLAKHPHIKPNTVEIEILETSALENFELTSNTLSKCQDSGISIAIDDFGTGYASLHYLKKLPMNTLKIDKSFIIDLLTTSQNISIVEASIGLAHAFNSHVVAEGVELEEHGKVLLQLGCQIAQGYVISKAMPAQDIESWMKSWKSFASWQTTKPLNADDSGLLHTTIEYNTWINSIEAFLQNKASILPELDQSKCYLGNWISHSATEEQRNHPEFEQLKEMHSELHSYVEKLLYSNEQDKEAGIVKLRELHKIILTKLEALASEISNGSVQDCVSAPDNS